MTRADYVVLALPDYNPGAYPAAEAARRFLDAAPVDLRSKRVIAVAFNAPYHLDTTQIGKLTAYFGVYSKTPEAIDAAVHAIFRRIEPHGSPPVSIPGAGYDLPQTLQPDPKQQLTLERWGSGTDGHVFTSKILDAQRRPVPDGTRVLFTIAQRGAVVATVQASTRDGVASMRPGAEAAGEVRVQAQVGSLQSAPLTWGRTPDASVSGSSAPLWQWGAALAIALMATVSAVYATWFRRTTPATGTVGGGGSPAPDATPAAAPAPITGLTVDPAARSVAVDGRMVSPALSPEQYRLVAYLYQRAGTVCARDEVVAHVWPDAHAEGVSEEALDALVRRVRERLTQAGATRRHLVTVRGHGLRLDP